MSGQTRAVLPAVKPNAGIDAWYYRMLRNKINRMGKSVMFWLGATYVESGLAVDATPLSQMQRELKDLEERWTPVFTQFAKWFSKSLAQRTQKQADATMERGLKYAGYKVKFQQTEAMKTAYQSVVDENINLIKSIPEQYFTQVRSLLNVSVSRGRDLQYLSDGLQKQLGVTKKRAALIARDQNNKATAAMGAARQRSVGITQGIWRHSHAGKEPRESHLKADGTLFELSKGLYLDGEWVLPGEAINCRCTWDPVIPGLEGEA